MTDVRRAIICGSTEGIGKAIAINLCKEGYAITLISRNLEKLKILKAELNLIKSNDHSFIQTDFDKPEEINYCLSKVDNLKLGKLVLVNNVGGPPPKEILECSINDFQRVFNKQVLSFSEVTKYFVPKMKEEKWGRIINIIGTTILEPIPGLGLSVIKGATANWSKALSVELGKYNITVNNVLPGPTKTRELDTIIEIFAEKANKTKEEFIKDSLGRIPLRRFAEPAEIADGVAFLSSDKASFITGTNLKIDGGFTTCLY